MLTVALTGGIATGKSYVRRRIAERGVPTLDADAVAHALLEPGTEATAEVSRRFGAGLVRPGGGIDRKALGRIVFADTAARLDLEALIHPRVYARIAEWVAGQRACGAAWILADIPLLFETRHEADFDRVMVAVCPRGEQVRRVMERDRLDEAAALARIAAQWPLDEKARRANLVIDTGGTFAETDRQVDAACEALDAAASARRTEG